MKRVGFFFCNQCTTEKPDEELARTHGPHGAARMCRSCYDRVAAIADGSWRDAGGATLKNRQRARAKFSAKTYRSGKRLPPWMFS